MDLSYRTLFLDLFFIIGFLRITTATSSILPENIFTAGRLVYRRLLLDPHSASLYVGANGHLFRLWAYNINITTSTDGLHAHVELPVSRADVEECRHLGHEECVNGIRSMFLKEGGQTLLVCSSNAVKPQLREVDALTLQERSSPENVIGVCSAQANLNTTAVLVEWGNPEDIPAIYSGIRTGLTLDNHLIYRPPLIKNNKEVYPSMRTIYTDSKWLYQPDFVASYNIGKYVYFFFREVAIEHENCGRVIYSRVARLCKKDVGGKNVLRQVWTSFIKARLNCSTSSNSPVYFNEIQSLQNVDGKFDTFFYATLTTPDTSFGGSAVCVFSLNAINQLLDHGSFLEQTKPGGSWVVTPSENVPEHRPGSCSSNSASVSDSDLNFARSHLLMADTVSAGGPLITVRNEVLTHIAVDALTDVNIIFAYSHSHHSLHKVAHWFEGGDTQSKLLATYSLKTTGSVYSIALLSNEFLYLGNEENVLQYSVAQCSHYTTCAQCAIDPYCSWNIARGLCHKREEVHSLTAGWINVGPKNIDKCSEHIRGKTIEAFSGDTMHLKCVAQSPTWVLGSVRLVPSEKRQMTTEGGLVVFNISSADTGTYVCAVDGVVVMVYDVKVDESDCAQPTSLAQFRSKYREWCKKFTTYKHSAEKWQFWYDRNAASCPNQPVSDSSHIIQ